ncbi:MAG: DoxX family protein [Opitutaceae bacterium]
MKSLLYRLLETTPSVTAAIARIVVGGVMLPHGLQKTLGWFGGYGLESTLNYFTGTMHLPWIVALAVVAAESVGAFLLLLGVATRVAAVGIASVMIGAVLTTHVPHGFFMNWFGQQKGEGFEFHLLALGLCAINLVAGGGWGSIDSWWQRRESHLHPRTSSA